MRRFDAARNWKYLAIGLMLWCGLGVVVAQGEPAGSTAAREEGREEAPGPPLTEYMGRRIAQTMHWTGAEWLIRETREKEEQPARVMKELGLKDGMTAADIGCGNGFYTLRLAKAVGPTGKAIGEEIQPEYFPLLKERAAAAGITNIELIEGTVADPKLEAGSCDVILLADVYHEFSYPEKMLAGIRKALKPTGRLVLLEFRAEDPAVPIKPLHKMSRAQVEKELSANGFRLAKVFEGLPWQHMMFFARDDAPADGAGVDGGRNGGADGASKGSGETDKADEQNNDEK